MLWLDELARLSRALPSLPGRLRFGRWCQSHWSTVHIADVNMWDSSVMRVATDVPSQQVAFWTAEYDKEVIQGIKSRLTQDAVVVDVGANVGFYSIPLARAVPAGHVYAIEPVPENVERLKCNIALNELTNVTVLPTAVAECEGVVSFSRESDHTGNAVMETIDRGAETFGSVKVQTLDTLTRDLRRCDFMKLDIEGAEYAALCGATDLLSRFGPPLLIELNGHWMTKAGWTVEDLRAFLTPYGYTLAAPSGQNIDTTLTNQLVTNLWAEVATPVGRRA